MDAADSMAHRELASQERIARGLALGSRDAKRGRLARLRDSARLHYWLGPWAARDAAPVDVEVTPVAGLAPGSRLYAPADAAPTGAVLLSPGLHYDGPRDPRMDRLARILASAGQLVLSPAIPDLMALQLTPRVVTDVAAAHAVLRAQPALPPGCRPTVLGISVGSLAALRLATAPDTARTLEQVIVFGGYADPAELFHALTEAPRDPLNTPAAMLTVLDAVPAAALLDRAALRAAWRRMIRATWPRPELKQPGSTAHHAIAHELARALPARSRALFLVGCGVEPGAWAHCRAALAAPGEAFAYLDPRPQLARIECPVTIVHGIADDVIPFRQAGMLAAALPARAARTSLATGLFAHSNSVALGASALVRELRTFHKICRALGGRGKGRAS